MSKTKTQSPFKQSLLRKLSNQVACASLASAAWLSTAAHAVNDLPGGPAVNQLNFAPPVTKIAEEQHWLHWFMMI
ncbi:MAG: Cytochrome c oxidase subunit 2 precursor, partial [Pseudomonadota bacterium]